MPALEKIMRLPAPEPGSLSGPLPASQVAAGDQNGDSTPIAPRKVEIVPTQTEVVGMIRPPADIRSIVDKTAQFVAKNGPEFEKRILANEKNNVKFNFLNATDYYHAYYQHRVNEFKKQLAAPEEGTARAVEAPAAAPVTAPVEEAPVPRKELVPPELEQYSVRVPEGISGLDLDVIKLTAQFVARNGKSFLSGLTQREHNNPQFYFLKPTHSLFGFFTTLADAYSKVLMPPKGLADRLKRDASNRQAVLERCIQRLEWEKVQLKSRRKEEEAAERERTQMALIDWHDFVVVTTIDFNEGEDEDLPEPLTLEEVVRKAKRLAKEEEEEEATAVAATEKDQEMEVEMDEEEMDLVEQGMRATVIEEEGEKAPEQADEDMDEGADEGPPPPPEEEEDAPIKIVKDYKRPEERAREQHDPTKFVVSPITGELIPLAEMAEHMRISLIDPKYKEQKERMLAKIKETTFAHDDEIAKNMVNLARTRPDIFGTTDEEVSNAVAKEVEKSKQEGGDGQRVIWDGSATTIGRVTTAALAQQQQLTIDEQIAQIHREKANVNQEGRPLPGPTALPPGPPKLNPTPAPRPAPPNLAINIPRPVKPPPQNAPPPQTLPPPPPPVIQRPPPQMVQRPPPQMQMPPQQMQMPMPPPPQQMHPPPQQGMRPPGPPPVGMFQPQMQRPPVAMPPPMQRPPPLAQAPPPPREMAPPPPPFVEEPEPKRQKVQQEEVDLMPEGEWLARHPGPRRLSVTLPNLGDDNPGMEEQTRTVEVSSLQETVGALKQQLAELVSVPPSKQKLSSRAGFLKDQQTLAYYNILPGETLVLSLKERGGKKK